MNNKNYNYCTQAISSVVYVIIPTPMLVGWGFLLSVVYALAAQTSCQSPVKLPLA